MDARTTEKRRFTLTDGVATALIGILLYVSCSQHNELIELDRMPTFNEEDRPFIDRTFAMAGHLPGEPSEEELREDNYPVAMRVRERVCVELAGKRGAYIGGHKLACFREKDGAFLFMDQVGE